MTKHQWMGHPQCGDGVGDRGLHGRHRPGDPAAPAVPDDRRAALAQGPHDARDICRQREGVVSARRLVGGSVAAQVDGGHVVPGLRECGQLVAPGPPELRKAVQENDERAFADLGHVKAGTVGCDEPVLPRSFDEHRRRIVAHTRRSRFDVGRCGHECWCQLLPGLTAAMVSWVLLMARSGLPLRVSKLCLPANTSTAPMTSRTPATMRNAAQGGSPAATSPYAAAISSRISARKARTPAVANMPAPAPAFLASAAISAFARATSLCTMDVMSRVASATSWPRVRSAASSF